MVLKDGLSINEMWENYLASIGEALDTTIKTYTAWHFENTQKGALALAQLVLDGKKCATASLVDMFVDEPLPQLGDISIITDFEGNALGIIETIKVDFVPYEQVNMEFIIKEGEGDRCIQEWREKHERFFTQELAKQGKAFTPQAIVVCEAFKLVYW